jgi:hypothetical protein
MDSSYVEQYISVNEAWIKTANIFCFGKAIYLTYLNLQKACTLLKLIIYYVPRGYRTEVHQGTEDVNVKSGYWTIVSIIWSNYVVMDSNVLFSS